MEGAPSLICQAGAPPESWLRVLHLNPAVYFRDVLREAHSTAQHSTA